MRIKRMYKSTEFTTFKELARKLGYKKGDSAKLAYEKWLEEEKEDIEEHKMDGLGFFKSVYGGEQK